MGFFSRKKKKSQAGLSSSLITAVQAALATDHPKTADPPSQPLAYPWSTQSLHLSPPLGLNKHGITPSSPLPSPFPRYGHAIPQETTSIGGTYLFGGLVQREILCNDLYFFSTQDNSVTRLQTDGALPLPRVGHAAALFDDVLIVWGGDTLVDPTVMDKPDHGLYSLDLIAKYWTRIPSHGPGPSGRYGHTANMIGSQFVVFGGQFNAEFFNDMWSFDIYSLWTKAVWNPIDPVGGIAPAPRTGHVCLTCDGRIYLFGGTDGQYHYNDTWVFDVPRHRWSELQCTGLLPPPREGHAAAVVDDVIYVFGGRGVEGKDLNDLVAFKIPDQRWFAFQDMGPASPSGRSGHAMTSVGASVYVLGGEALVQSTTDDPSVIHVLDTDLRTALPSQFDFT
ncbi:hypothetical protein FPV67DRAFT_1523012 [Lyophyllum atratum]|nr:hypothetical protein FPV67DRAFT_1523012 [Lyophyllum atratum]